MVRGTSVAYGYLGDEEKTQKAFMQNPNNSVFYDPLYATGDLVEIDKNEDFIFIGRADNQIKYLGYRIELGEIEAAITNIDIVVEGVVVFGVNPAHGNDEIGAYLQLIEGASIQDFANAIKGKLPEYMTPTKLVVCEQDFPRTPNGKYDRKVITQRVFNKS